MKLLEVISRYLEHKHSLGYKLQKEEFILKAFGKHVGDVPINSITTAMVLGYINNRNGRVTESWFIKHRVLAGLFHFALTRCFSNVSPMPRSIPKKTVPDFVPYIYTHAELKKLLDSIAPTCSARVPIDIEVLRTLILLLYGTGLRLGEALSLTTHEVNLNQRYVYIHETKFFKSRFVPLGTDLMQILTEYIKKRIDGANPEAIPLFSFRDGSRLSQSATRNAFRRMRLYAGIQREGGPRCQPRLQDLRHSFAVHRLVEWYQNNADLKDLLPKLAIYMGHKDLISTQHYLTMTPELLEKASLRFERYARGEPS